MDRRSILGQTGGIETASRLSGIDSCADLMKVCN